MLVHSSEYCGMPQVYGLSGPVARYIGRNGPILHRFANEDVTLGAWLVGLEVTHVDERRLCCDSAERCQAQVRSPARHTEVLVPYTHRAVQHTVVVESLVALEVWHGVGALLVLQ